jgi:hypothetical protein
MELESSSQQDCDKDDAVATGTLWCSGFSTWNKPKRLPHHQSCTICSNMNTVFLVKALFNHMRMNTFEYE